jgi:hypothetical protein
MKNPPAFPQQFNGTSEPSLSGLSMRDYFAAKAMQGLLSDPDWRIDLPFSATASAAYKMADAMMKEREA